MNITPSSIPFYIARAHGVERAIAVSRTRQAARVQPIESTRTVESQTNGPSALVGAIVPGRIDFTDSLPLQRAEALSMYRRPSDHNAAATGVEAGRVVDVSG